MNSFSPGVPRASAWQPTRTMHWYDSIIDVMLTNPGISQKEIGALLGRNPVTIGVVINSDLFKGRYNERRRAFDQALHEKMAAKIAGVAERSLDLTLEVLNKKQTAVPLETLVDINSQTLSMLGYGPKQATAPNVNVNVAANSVAVSQEDLARARSALREKERDLIQYDASSESVSGGAPAKPGEE